MPTKIFIGNLNSNVLSDDIRVLFEKYGKVTECDVLKNYGFVHMAEESEAKAAISELDGYSVKGSRMRVEESTGKTSGRGGRGGGRGRGGVRGGGRGRGGGGPDRFGSAPPRYDPYARRPPLPPFDYYDRPPYPRERPPMRGDDRRLPPADDRYRRDPYYDRPDPYDRYDRSRGPPPDPYRRPPPDYYNRQRYPYDDPYYPERRGYPDDQGDMGPPPPRDFYNGYNYPDAANRGAPPSERPPPPANEGPANYYDRFYKNPPSRPGPMQHGSNPPVVSGNQGFAAKKNDDQSFLQTEPIFF